MSNKHVVARCMVLAVVASLVLVVSATAGGAQTQPAEGVTSDSVTIGYVSSLTGSAASTFKNAGKACEARIGRANAKGGVNGRTIDLQVVDDMSGGGNLTAVQDLVQNRHAFAVVNNSPFALLGYRYLLDHGVPMVGGGFDGTYYGQKGNENILSATGNVAPFNGLAYDVYMRMMKKLGVKKSAALAYGVSPSSTASTETAQNYAAPAAGIKPVYTNTSIEFGSSDVGPVVLGIKNSGADGVYMPLVAETNVAVVQGLAQNGVDTKANILLTGYGQDLLDSPAAATLKPNTIVAQLYKPVEIKDPATKQFQADLKKYSGLTGIPDYGQYLGYITCDMAVTALEQAGKNPTAQSFVDGFRNLKTYDDAGLSCQELNVSLASYGKYADRGCAYFMYVKDGKFVVMNKGKPLFGKLVGSKQLLEANATGNPALATTTTAAAAPAS